MMAGFPSILDKTWKVSVQVPSYGEYVEIERKNPSSLFLSTPVSKCRWFKEFLYASSVNELQFQSIYKIISQISYSRRLHIFKIKPRRVE